MHCSTPQKYAELASKSSLMCIRCGVQGFRRELLTAHSKSGCHVVYHTRLLKDQKPENRPLQNIRRESQARLEKLFNTSSLTKTDASKDIFIQFVEFQINFMSYFIFLTKLEVFMLPCSVVVVVCFRQVVFCLKGQASFLQVDLLCTSKLCI